MAGVMDGVMAASMVFDRWTLHGDGRLTGEGVEIQLPPKEWQVLRLLLASAGMLVSKDRLLEQAWPHNEATEESLTRCICSLRKYLKDGRGLIKTVYGKGYRVTCAVKVMSQASSHVCSTCGRGQA
ncbi:MULTISPECIES: winged helix-turn-helix domain-containing protein [unclassified Pseudomonas]|uniref:winged helix-turn-helix domain-containing protein n=1 Tax=unclassified Pseudomonas TaxID=196821 RepID=UPI0015A04891|nr:MULTISPECIES: winged helix-turn-helix domain-containing protein [unclassified Pseudomonas]NWC97010.1 winged helix-turn-helix domain-containing protein [Pseudomonas sp. IPO3779]NWD21591.1 winged helix-turn-helix domain-containing protein [Pseudomonas sp. IPO3778]